MEAFELFLVRSTAQHTHASVAHAASSIPIHERSTPLSSPCPSPGLQVAWGPGCWFIRDDRYAHRYQSSDVLARLSRLASGGSVGIFHRSNRGFYYAEYVDGVRVFEDRCFPAEFSGSDRYDVALARAAQLCGGEDFLPALTAAKFVPFTSSDDQHALFTSKRSFASSGDAAEGGTYVAVADLLERIAAALEPVLAPAGFKRSKNNKTFTRRSKGRRERIQIVSYDYVHYEFDLHFTVQIDEIQRRVTTFHFEQGRNAESNPKKHDTLIFTLSECDSRIVAATYGHLEVELAAAAEFVRQRALPAIDATADILSLSRSLNHCSTRVDDRLLLHGFEPSFVTALTVAHVASDPQFDAYVESTRATVEEHELETLDALVSSLPTGN